MDDTHHETDDPPANVSPVERHSARAALYGGAAMAFCYPDEETVAELTHDDTAEGLRAAAAKLGFESEVEDLLAALDSTTRDDLQSAYNDLFGLPDDGTYPVVPYEAEYAVGDEVGRQQRRIATVVGLLEAFGVEPASDFHERQDHVVVELELMQVLAARRAVARKQGETEGAENVARVESVVVAEHLSGFVPAFAHDLRQAVGNEEDEATETAGASAVYRAAGDLAEAVVTRDEATHDEPDADFEPNPEVRSRA